MKLPAKRKEKKRTNTLENSVTGFFLIKRNYKVSLDVCFSLVERRSGCHVTTESKLRQNLNEKKLRYYLSYAYLIFDWTVRLIWNWLQTDISLLRCCEQIHLIHLNLYGMCRFFRYRKSSFSLFYWLLLIIPIEIIYGTRAILKYPNLLSKANAYDLLFFQVFDSVW